jgi:hypothetical protein
MQAEPTVGCAIGRGRSRLLARGRRARRGAVAAAVLCTLLCAGLRARLTIAPALALDDRDICVLAEQLAVAAQKDVGIWIDRATRNAGMRVSCDAKTIEYSRFTYAPSASMTDAWKARKDADWNGMHCDSAIWRDAIVRGWKIILSQTAADGGRVSFTARCG